jgi:hypothetical protein
MSSAEETPAVPPVQPPLAQWEYRTHYVEPPHAMIMLKLADLHEVDQALSAHGAQGWELASSFVQQYLADGAYRIVLIFKRPKQR